MTRRLAYAEASGKFIKFVKLENGKYVSPNFDGGQPIEYKLGERIATDGEISDQQCAVGLHVFIPGVRPDWCGYCDAEIADNLVGLICEVDPADILFAGWPGCAEKLRVRALTPTAVLQTKFKRG